MNKLFRAFSNIKIKNDHKTNYSRYGYIIHKHDNSIHSHGLKELKDIYDFEITLDKMSMEVAKDVIKFHIRKTSKGNTNLHGNVAIIDADGNYTWLRPVKKDGRYLYRIIFSDPNNLAPWNDNCDPRYKAQWTEEDEISNKEIIDYEENGGMLE